MTGWKDWQIGEVVTESDFQSFVQDQVVQRYADASARTSTLGTAIAEGMVSYLEDTNSFEVYDGSAWVGLAGGFTVSDTAPTAPSEGDTWYNSTNGNLYTYYDSYWVETSAPAQNISAVAVTAPITNSGTSTNAVIGIDENVLVGRNYVINGAFDFWQRGTSFASLSTFGNFTADRWRYNTGGATATVSQQSFSPADIEATGFGDATYYLRCNFDTAGNQFQGMQNLVEDVRNFAGQTVTLSAWIRGNVARDVGLAVVQNFGSGGSSNITTSDIVSVNTTWQRYSVTLNIPTVSGKTIGAGSYLQVAVQNQEQTTGYFDLWGVQLEAGSVATPFRRHAPSLQGELAACQRYYFRITAENNAAPIGVGYANSTTQAPVYINFPVVMRTRPLSLEQSGTSTDYEVLRQGTNVLLCSSIPALIGGDSRGAYVWFTVSSGLTAGEAVIGRFDGTNGFLGWSAEL